MSALKPNPLHVCEAIRNSMPDAAFRYTNGACWEFHKILRSIFPDAKPWTNIDHVWTEIGGKLYDINGLRAAGKTGLLDEPSLFKNAHRWVGRSNWYAEP